MTRTDPIGTEDIQAVIDALVPVMIQHNYQRRDSTWYYFTPELLRVFEFHPSQFRNRAFLNIGLLPRALNDSTRPRAKDCSVHIGVYHLITDHEQYETAVNFGDPSLATTQRVAYIAKTVHETVLPFLANFKSAEDVHRYMRSPLSKGWLIHRSAKHLFT